MRGSLTKYRDRWRGQVYLGKDNQGRDVRRSKVFNHPHTIEGRRAAEAAMATWVDEVTEAQGHDKPTSRTVAELLNAWQQAEAASWSVKHRASTELWCRAKIVPHIGDIALDQLEPSRLATLYAELIVAGGADGQPMAASSVKRAHTILRTAFRRAIEWGWVTSDPTDKVKPPKVRKPQISAPTVAQIETATNAVADPMWAAYLRLAFTTGARRSQIIGLRWSDIDADRHKVTFKRGVTAERGEVEIKGTKSDVPYIVTVDTRTLDLLSRWRVEQSDIAGQLGVGIISDPFVFSVGGDGSKPIWPATVNTWWDRLGLKEPSLRGVRPHDLRHFAASHLLAKGEPVLKVAARLGHKDPAVTLRVYGHFIPGDDQSSADIMSEIG